MVEVVILFEANSKLFLLFEYHIRYPLQTYLLIFYDFVVFTCYRNGWLGGGYWNSGCYSRWRRWCSWQTVNFAYSFVSTFSVGMLKRTGLVILSRANWRPVLKNLSLEIEAIKGFCVQGFRFWVTFRCYFWDLSEMYNLFAAYSEKRIMHLWRGSDTLKKKKKNRPLLIVLIRFL